MEPRYIERTVNYQTKDVITAQEFNNILNLLIEQGNYNSHWLAELYDIHVTESNLFNVYGRAYSKGIIIGPTYYVFPGSAYVEANVNLSTTGTTDCMIPNAFTSFVDFSSSSTFLECICSDPNIHPESISIDPETYVCTVTMPMVEEERSVKIRIYAR